MKILNQIKSGLSAILNIDCEHDYQLQCQSKHLERLNEITINVSSEYRNICKKCGHTKPVAYSSQWGMPPPFILEKPNIWHDYNPKPIREIHYSEILRIEYDKDGREIKILDFNKIP